MSFTTLFYSDVNGMEIEIFDLKVNGGFEKGYEFLSREFRSIPENQDVYHLFLNLKTVITENDGKVSDSLYLHVICVGGVLYWDHTNFVTYLFDSLSDDDMAKLTTQILKSFYEEITITAPPSRDIYRMMKTNKDFKIL